MSSSALTSQGMIIYWGSLASPGVYTAINEVTSIDGPGGQSAEIDVTDLSSAAKETVLGLQDEGDITMEINYIPQDAGHSILRTAKGIGGLRSYRIAFTDSPATLWTFNARVKGFTISNAVDGVTRATVTLRISGSITET